MIAGQTFDTCKNSHFICLIYHKAYAWGSFLAVTPVLQEFDPDMWVITEAIITSSPLLLFPCRHTSLCKAC